MTVHNDVGRAYVSRRFGGGMKIVNPKHLYLPLLLLLFSTRPALALFDVTGVVMDATHNTPCAGAYVEVDAWGNSTVTDNSGFFYLSNLTLSGGYHYIQVSQTAFAPYRDSEVAWVDNSVNHYQAGLYVGAQLSGYVYDHDSGMPLAGVTITAENDPTHTSWTQIYTQSDGSYQLYQPPGLIRLRAEDLSHAPSKSLVLTVQDQLAYGGNNFFLFKGGGISGTVVYADSGLPVAGAMVNFQLAASDDYQFRVSAITDGSGFYSHQHLFPEPYNVVVSAPAGYADGYRFSVEVTDQNTTAMIDFALMAGGSLQGQVNDYQGQPVNNAQVTVFPANGNSNNRKYTVTDSSGNYTLSGVDLGQYALSIVPQQGQNLQSAQISGIKILPAVIITRNVTLQAGGKLAGIIVDHLNQPVSNAEIRVSLDLQYPFEDLFREIYSNSLGYFQVDGLSPYQSYTLAVQPPASNTINAQAVVKGLTVAENETKQQLIKLPTGGMRFGYVMNTSNQPITSGMAVAFNAELGLGNEFQDNNGLYQLQSLPANDYLQIIIPGNEGNYQSSYGKFHLTAGQADYANVTLPAGGVIEGIVVDASGNSAVGVQLLAIKPSGLLASMPFFAKQAFTDFGGYYRLEGLESGNYTVVVLPAVDEAGGAGAQSRTILSTPGQTVQQNFHLTGDGAKVYGTVRDEYGNRMANSWVVFWNSSMTAYTTADQWGNYNLMLPPGNYAGQAMFTAMLGSNVAVEPALNITVEAAPQTEYKEFIMRLGGTVKGTIKDQLGAPVPLAFVALSQANNPLPLHYTMTDQNGNYTVSGLHSGLYTITATHEDYALANTQTFVTLGGSTFNQNVIIVQNTTIAGSVKSRGNRVVGHAQIKLYSHGSTQPVQQVSTDQSGAFILNGLASGSYDVKASATGLKSLTMTNLTPGDRADFVLEPLISQNEAISYPNPCRQDQLTFLYWLDEDSTVLIRVYNQSGRLVWDWEGQGKGNTYNNHVWQVSGVAPGVYLFIITARDQHNETHRFPAGRLTVIK